MQSQAQKAAVAISTQNSDSASTPLYCRDTHLKKMPMQGMFVNQTVGKSKREQMFYQSYQ